MSITSFVRRRTLIKALMPALALPLLMAVDCGSPVAVPPFKEANAQESPVWAPDGTRLIYNERNNLYLVNGDGPTHQPLFDRPLTKCCDGDFSPSVSPDGTLAFATFRERSGLFSFLSSETSLEIGTSALDGSGYRTLTDDKAIDTNPVWSPDGSRIAFVSDRAWHEPIDDDSYQYGFSIYTMAPDGSDIQRVTPLSLNTIKDPPIWSPDGSRIAFSTEESYQNEAGRWIKERVLHTVSADGRDLRRVSVTSAGSITASLTTVRPTWSPDGGLIAFAVTVGRPRLASKFYTARPDGSDLKQVAELDLLDIRSVSNLLIFSNLRSVSSLIWSLDGSWFLFAGTEYTRGPASLSRKEAALYALRTDGSLTRKLTILDDHRTSPLIAMSPDGSRVAVRHMSASPDGAPLLYTIALDGSDKRVLARWGGHRG